jgi:hypothetical protein
MAGFMAGCGVTYKIPNVAGALERLTGSALEKLMTHLNGFC